MLSPAQAKSNTYIIVWCKEWSVSILFVMNSEHTIANFHENLAIYTKLCISFFLLVRAIYHLVLVRKIYQLVRTTEF